MQPPPPSDFHTSPPAGRLAAVTAIILTGVYAYFGSVWSFDEVRFGLIGAAWLWLPMGLFLFAVLRRECADTLEALVLAGSGTLGLTTALSFASDTLAIAWPWAKHLPAIVRGLLF